MSPPSPRSVAIITVFIGMVVSAVRHGHSRHLGARPFLVGMPVQVRRRSPSSSVNPHAASVRRGRQCTEARRLAPAAQHVRSPLLPSAALEGNEGGAAASKRPGAAGLGHLHDMAHAIIRLSPRFPSVSPGLWEAQADCTDSTVLPRTWISTSSNPPRLKGPPLCPGAGEPSLLSAPAPLALFSKKVRRPRRVLLGRVVMHGVAHRLKDHSCRRRARACTCKHPITHQEEAQERVTKRSP